MSPLHVPPAAPDSGTRKHASPSATSSLTSSRSTRVPFRFGLRPPDISPLPADAVENGWSAVIAVPPHPRKCHTAVRFAASPFVTMKHRQPLAEYMHAGEAAIFEDAAAAFGLEECQPQEQDHDRAKLERMRNNFLDDLKRRICQNALTARRHLFLCEKVSNEVQWRGGLVVIDVGAGHVVPLLQQDASDGAAAGAWLPHRERHRLGPQ